MIAGPFCIGSTLWPGGTKVTEEAAELIQVLAKLMAVRGHEYHYDGSNLHDRLVEEIGDLKAALDYFLAMNPEVPEDDVEERRREKLALFWTWHHDERRKGDRK